MGREEEDGKKVTWGVEEAAAGLAEVDKDDVVGDVQRKGGLRLRRWMV